MKREWINKNKEKFLAEIELAKKEVIAEIAKSKFSQADKQWLTQAIMTLVKDDIDIADIQTIMSIMYGFNRRGKNDFQFDEYKKIRDDLRDGLFKRLELAINAYNNIESFADSDWVEFDGDIVITDPCYTENTRDFNYDIIPMYRDTIYGDWSCTTFNKDNGDELGTFCADAGLVCVDTLENILKRYPDFTKDYSNFDYTLINNFKGKVQFRVVYEGDYEVQVHGEGINSKTGEPINFYTMQTGF